MEHTQVLTTLDGIESEEDGVEYTRVEHLVGLPDLLDDEEVERLSALQIGDGMGVAVRGKKKKKKKKGGGNPKSNSNGYTNTNTTPTPTPTPTDPQQTQQEVQTPLDKLSRPVVPYRFRRQRFRDGVGLARDEWVCFFCEFEQVFGGSVWRRGRRRGGDKDKAGEGKEKEKEKGRKVNGSGGDKVAGG